VQLLEPVEIVWPRARLLSARVHSFGQVRQVQPYTHVSRNIRISHVQPLAPSQTRQGVMCRPQLTPLQLPKRDELEETPVVRSWQKGACSGSVGRTFSSMRRTQHCPNEIAARVLSLSQKIVVQSGFGLHLVSLISWIALQLDVEMDQAPMGQALTFL